MAPRAQLQQLLEDICDNVYFQPPMTVQMVYPAIVYRRAPESVKFANNSKYNQTAQYEVTLISRDPDSEVVRSNISKLPMTRHDRFFVADNLNHDVFTIYF